MNFIQVASLIAVFQSCFVSIQLWTHERGRYWKNKILSFYMLILALLIFTAYTVTDPVAGFFIPYHKIIFFVNLLAYLIGPLLYFYLKGNLTDNFRFQRKDILHFIPFIIMMILSIIFILPQNHFVTWQYKPRIYNTTFLLSFNLVYFIMAMRLLKKKKSKKNIETKVMWLLLVSFIVLWLIQLNFLVILNFFRIYKYCPHMTSLYSICAFLFINLIAFFASRKSEFYNQLKRYEISSLQKSEINLYKLKLIHLMEKNKPYLNQSLSLLDLANQLALPHRELSQVINESFNQNFYDFINSYRIDDFERILDNGSNSKKTILEIAYEVGFNSKSAFNRAFKKQTGITPKEYKKSIHRSKRSNQKAV